MKPAELFSHWKQVRQGLIKVIENYHHDLSFLAAPEGWPAGLPQYPGSKLELANTATDDDGTAMTIFMTTADDPAKVAEFYAGKAAAMGMKQVTKMAHGEMVTAHYQSAEWMLNLGCGTQEEGTGITLILSPGDGTVPEGEGTGANS